MQCFSVFDGVTSDKLQWLHYRAIVLTADRTTNLESRPRKCKSDEFTCNRGAAGSYIVHIVTTRIDYLCILSSPSIVIWQIPVNTANNTAVSQRESNIVGR